MKKITTLALACLTLTCTWAQTVKSNGYEFTIKNQAKCTSVKNQEKTGTCWCYAGTSFLESEVMRTKNLNIDLSEMFGVRYTYANKAEQYVRYQGKTNFGEGGLSHDAINALKNYGVMPQVAFEGRKDGGIYNHAELSKSLEKQIKEVVSSKKITPNYLDAVNETLNAEIGTPPTEFLFNSQKYTPKSFARELGLDATNYVSLTSYTHHPFYENFVLEIPDNFSHGSFYNLPLGEFTAAIDAALEAGYTVSWDADVSNEGFNFNEGMALLPAEDEKKPFKKPCIELTVTQQSRQQAFDEQSATDDHLMHIVGIANDQKGRPYYIVKNSWGETNDQKGYLYCSKPYFEMNTISVLLNKNALNTETKNKLGIK